MQAVETNPAPPPTDSVPPAEYPRAPRDSWPTVAARWLQFAIPRVVGLVFVWAGSQKLADPTKIIRVLEFDGLTQRIGEVRLAVVGAYGLGAFEAVLGALLIVGLWQRRVITITIAMLFVFSIQLAYLIFAQNPPECGCITLWEKFRDARSRATSGLIRNAAMAVGLEWTRLRVVRAAAALSRGIDGAGAPASEAVPPSPAPADAPSDTAPGTV